MMPFQRLPHLMVVLCYSNPGIVYECTCEGTPYEYGVVFGKWFWLFRPSIKDLPHWAPLINVDATRPYRKYTGKILMALTCDSDNQIFILYSKSDSSWTQFLERLHYHVMAHCLNFDQHQQTFFMCDQIYRHCKTYSRSIVFFATKQYSSPKCFYL